MTEMPVRLGLSDIAPQRVLPVLVLDDASVAPRVREALAAGGLSCAEVTLRTPAAVRAMAGMAEDPDFLVGAGTVLTRAQVRDADEAGARFVVSPGFSRAVAAECADRGLAYVPGVATPTDITAALDEGFSELKFFPAETLGGVRALTALCGPFGDVRFLPTGGLTEANFAEYLAIPAVTAVGGSWIATPALVGQLDFEEIARRATHAVHASQPSGAGNAGRR
jgi:2-dehydro-3-deoxyphosphogluconate aldolase/(4S)-4-hydroxy-2-oxoglutarate aldolase